MTLHASKRPLIAVACGGTGGHFFPGLAVAEVLDQKGCEVALLISSKQVDQEAAKSAAHLRVITLPAVALQKGALVGFIRGAWRSYLICRREFQRRVPQAVLAMGGFTSAPPILAGKRLGAATFVHEANSIPGRANRWLAPRVDEVFLAFPGAGRRMSARNTTLTGMPVRSSFRVSDSEACRMALGLKPQRPVLLITGGSQGASAINELICQALPSLTRQKPELQFFHLTGPSDLAKVQAAYAAVESEAQVFPFLTEMELALGAATLIVSRAGASSLAELAAMRVPAILIPYPAAADNHQFHNARAFVESGAARQLAQSDATPARLSQMIIELLEDEAARAGMSAALQRWNTTDAAERIAARMLAFADMARASASPAGQGKRRGAAPAEARSASKRPRGWPRQALELS